ncbi:MAG: THUMP domain-containing protein [Planctomycetota bacterium]
MSRRFTFFATCAPGLEAVLHGEIRALRLARPERQVGGVRFEGSLAEAWRANLELRTAIRVLLRLARFPARDGDELHRAVAAVDWSEHLGPDGTLAVDAQTSESRLDHSRYVEQRVKDAIVDRLRREHGRRPAVHRDDPDLRVHLHLWRDRATLSLDTSGASLHKRGWRVDQGRAPLAETLAAGIVLLAGWDRRAPLLDPFCGSGTILVEAALFAAQIAPGLFRARFGFERWPGHDAAACAALREELRRRAVPLPRGRLRGADLDPARIEGARRNAAAAGVEAAIELAVGDAAQFAPRRGWNAWVVTNPPYGERIGEEDELLPLYRELGARLRERCAGYRVAIFSGNPRLARALALEPIARHPLTNGALACELLRYEIPAVVAT